MGSTAQVAVTGLTIDGPAGVVVAPFDFSIAPGETLALIGESGSGKTLSAKAIAGLLPAGFNARGTIALSSATIELPSTDAVWRATRGRRISLLLQDPFTSLSPVHRCGTQIGMTIDAASATRLSREERTARITRSLAEVNLPADVARAYPHELSGGMRQRVAIAAALATDPELLIADEPTTALDASNQCEILDLLRGLQEKRGMAALLISHDLGMVRGRAEHVLVMRHGEIVERGVTSSVLNAPSHPYTRALIEADPSLTDRSAGVVRTASGPGVTAADAAAGPSGTETGTGTANPDADADAETGANTATGDLVVATDITKSFGDKTVLHGVSVTVGRGETVGIVGESGSGKTTIARCVAGLEHETSGVIEFDGVALAAGRASRTPKQMQIVFQDPYSSLNPMISVGRSLKLALRVAGRPASDLNGLLQLVELPTDFASKRPAELSGGQRQRVAIARALAVQPQLLICDESVSALDVSVQKQILDLLAKLRVELGLSILFISHDLAVVRQLADRVYVLRHGEVVESGQCHDVLNAPTHPYTQALVAASIHEAPTH
ncbi:ABC transporter ATP-binding protein [Salinibacterium sp. NSLL150]|nr:ABC transporter ATP-binding protein [Salinibacterium sp. NSLL35]MBH0100878.1 ABC transporter ATP-binding protein [Salinibacterium sp. NSLL150]MBH0103637.1 ABC transporter ATP-binding protein [Salinibacterium sp. NSLL16]MBH0106398.1 ABC transporter ATP-binding protein [Salinibacterium sp. NSLL17]